jgi:EmrB/QacA subfamily drug resistance transporter
MTAADSSDPLLPDAGSGRPAGPEATPSPDRRWLILAVIGVAQLMVVLDATIVNIALPSAQRALGFSTTDRQWVITAYALAFGGLLVVGGRLSDLLGRKRTFITGLAGFAIASAAGGAAPDFAALVAARAVQGAFGALLAPSALALLITTFTDPRERGKALGIYTAIAGGGGAIGLILGGALTEYLSWRWCLYVNVVFAGGALAGAIPLITNPPRNRGARFDVPGALLAASGLVGIVYGLSQAAADGWGSAHTVGPIVAGVVLLAAFAAVERRVARPLVPLGIITDRTRGPAYLGALIAGIGLIGTFLLVTYYLQGVLGFSPLRAGLAFLPFIAGVVVAANFVSNVGLERFGPKLVVPAGMVLAAAAAAWLTGIGVHGGYGSHVAPALVLLGLGTGAVVTSAFTLGPVGARPADSGVAAALVNSSNQVGGSLGAALLNTIAASAAASYLAGSGPRPSPLAATVHGDVVAFTFLIALFAAGAVVTALLYPRRSRLAAIPSRAATARSADTRSHRPPSTGPARPDPSAPSRSGR